MVRKLISDDEIIIGILTIEDIKFEKKSTARRILGIITTLIITLLITNYFNFIMIIFSREQYVNSIISRFPSFLPISKQFFFLMSIILSIILTSAVVLTFINKKIGILNELRGVGRKKIITFSEAFYIAFFGSLVSVYLFPIVPTTDNISFENLIFYGYFAVAIAPLLEETIFRFVFLVLPVAIKEFMHGDKRRAKAIVISGKDRLEMYDYIFILISSLVFGIAHLMGGWSFNKIFQATFLGLFLAYIALKGGIFVSIAFHWMWNALSTLLLISLLMDPYSASFFIAALGIIYFAIILFGVVETIILILREVFKFDV